MTRVIRQEALLSDIEPIPFRPRSSTSGTSAPGQGLGPAVGQPQSAGSAVLQLTRFDRAELAAILNVYGRQVAAGEWRDYAMDFLKDKAVFAVYRRTSEYPLYRIEKTPRLARKQGAYSVVTATGLILKRGSDLKRVLAILDRKLLAIRTDRQPKFWAISN